MKSKIRIGDLVEGIMGVHGGAIGTVQSIGSPFSSTGSPTVHVKSANGEVWETYGFNLKRKAIK